jgi:hypothetical protein
MLPKDLNELDLLFCPMSHPLVHIKNFLILAFCIVLPSADLIAQKPAKGFIITLESDTLEGYILDRIDAALSARIEFSTEKDGEKVPYLSSDLKGFGFHYGRVFRQIHYSEKAGDTSYFFAKRVLQGRVGAFTRRKLNRDQPDIYLVNNGLDREVLIVPPSKEFIEGQEGKKYVAEEFKHVGLLKYVKDEVVLKDEKKRGLGKYSEKDILREINDYNSSYSDSFPTIAYQERRDFSYDITAGLPIAHSDEEVYFRVALYRNKTFPEKSRTVSFMKGVSYRYWQSTKEPDLEVETSNLNYRQQFLGLMPIGIHFHSAKGVVRPYIYCAAGLSILISTDYHVVNYIDTGSRTTVVPVPMINMGTGIKIKIGSKFIVAEVTPALGTGIFMNIGYSF